MEAVRGGIVGRERELAALGRFIEGVTDRPQDLLLEGEAGIGKTTLWRAGMDAALAAGHRVLVSRPGESETKLSYSGVGDLLRDVFDEALADAPIPQRRALEVALLRKRPGSHPPDQRAVALGLLAGLRKLSASSPLVIGVDDIQWLDGSSAWAISFALRRLTGDPAAILATRRLEPGSADLVDLMGAIKGRDAIRLHIGPLDVEDVARILRDRSSRSLAPPLVARVHEAARGNPFFSLEIAHALGDAEPAVGRPLPVPADIHDVLRERIGALSANARDVALVVSAMARPTLGTLRAAKSEQSMVDTALTEAEDAGVLILAGERIDFVHPLLGSTVYWSASQGKRQAVHARLAEVSADREERARHLALMGAGPDPVRASLVQEAAEHARNRGAPLAAAELLELSAQLTPRDDEPRVCSRMRSAALNRFDAGDVRGGRAMLETLIGATESRQQHAVTRMELAIRSFNDVDRVHDLLRSAIEDVGDHPFFLSIIRMNLAWVALCRLEPANAADHARAAIDFAERVSDPHALRLALGVFGEAQALLGLDAEPTLLRAAAIGVNLTPGESVQPARLRGQQMLWAGRIAEARRSLREADLRFVDAGLELMRHDTLPILSEVECAAGDWATAARYADEGFDIVVHSGLDEIRDQMLYARAHAAALRGHLDDGRRDATEGLSLAAAGGNRWMEVANRSVLGFIALSEGDPVEAVRLLEPAEQLLAGKGIAEPGAFPFIADLAEALVAVGRLERAKRLVDQLHEQGVALDRALALATAARCRALIAAGLGDPPGALLALERALIEHERVAMPFEFARTLLIHGETLRRMKRKRESRDSLERARKQFEVLGASPWKARAEEALGRIGGRSASPTELSETERRVADVVARGFTNKEAAERLFMSVKTVESNLRRVYQKLGIRSRTELARRHRPSLPRGQVRPDPDDQT
jgi:DNA-binding CsgD family transcriptional regulator